MSAARIMSGAALALLLGSNPVLAAWVYPYYCEDLHRLRYDYAQDWVQTPGEEDGASYTVFDTYFGLDKCFVSHNNFYDRTILVCQGPGLGQDGGGVNTMAGRSGELAAMLTSIDSCDGTELVERQEVQVAFDELVSYGTFEVETRSGSFLLSLGLRYYAGQTQFVLRTE